MKNFIWDFDGTIFDSYPHFERAFRIMMDNHNKKYDPNEALHALHISFDYTFEKYLLNESEILEFKNYTAQTELKPEIKPFDDAKNVLEYISEHGGVNYIYTHRNKKSLEFYLKKYNMYHLFNTLITSDDGFDRKPSPEAIEYLVEKHNLDKDATIMIGDREIDVLSGVNAGVYGGIVSKDKIQTAANYVFSDISAVKNLI